jgi:hypothetical protein
MVENQGNNLPLTTKYTVKVVCGEISTEMTVDGSFDTIMVLNKFKMNLLPADTDIKSLSVWFQGRKI